MQALRQHYLQALGIQVWRCRETLPGAKPDARFNSMTGIEGVVGEGEKGVLDSALPAPTSSELTTRAGAEGPRAYEPGDSAIEPLQDALLEKAPQASASQQSSAATVQTTEISQTANPEFRIASIVFPGVCLIVTQVPVQIVNPVSPNHLEFLKELLQSIEKPVAVEPEITFFNWPMLRSADFDQSAAAAKEASQAFLRGQMSRHSVGLVLLMGEAPGQYLLPEGEFLAAQGGRSSGTSEQPGLLTHSVEGVFTEPLLKAQLWRELQPLVASLQQR